MNDWNLSTEGKAVRLFLYPRYAHKFDFLKNV